MTSEITIPLDLPDLKVISTEITREGDFHIHVESTIDGTTCRKCGREISSFHSLDDFITLRHLPILDRRTFIIIRPKRYRCPYCEGGPTTTQRLSWYSPKSPNTTAYERYILLKLVNSTIEDVAVKEDIGYKAVEAILDRWIREQIDWDEIKRVKILGLDEIALKKGHKNFVVIVTVRTSLGEVYPVAVLPDRKKETVRRYLESLPKRVKRSIKSVCTDLYEGFINAAKEVLVKARIVADRFHIAKIYSECADQLRKEEMRRLKKELSKEEYEEIKGVMWAFRKKKEDLEEEEKEKLKKLFEYSPLLKQAYHYRERMRAIFEDKDVGKEEAKKKIKNWRRRVKAVGLECYEKFIKTLENWMEEISNYFEERETSGYVEGLNNKIKVMKRRSYGIYNLKHLYQRIYLDVRGYKVFAGSDC